ncbi:MAG: TonB family protein [Bacteroidetes bacterium]|nr:TonB family protein [Bacteroidota bacterium]
MKNIVFLIAFVLPFSLFSQDYKDPGNMQVSAKDAHYEKGDVALYNYVYEKIKFSKEAIANKPAGDVMISFDVESDSTLTGFKVVSGIGYGVDEEIVKVLKTLKFVPSIQNGFPIKMNLMYTFPIRL